MSRHAFINKLRKDATEDAAFLRELAQEKKAIREFRKQSPEFKITRASVQRKQRFQWLPLTHEEQWLRNWCGHWRPGSFYFDGVGYIDSNVVLIDRVCE